MRVSTPSRPIRFLLACLLVGLLAAMGWKSLRREDPTPLPSSAGRAAEAIVSGESPPSPPDAATATIRPYSAPAGSDESAPLRPPPLELSTGPLLWEQQLAAAAARGRDAAGRAREIFALLPQLPEEALATAAEQAVERLPDADYTSIAQPVILNPQTHGQVLSVLFADMMERPDGITLPALLAIARDPVHPFAAAAADNLRLLVGAEFGTDRSKWDEAVADALARKAR
jgi:hypothetical protein